MVHGSREPGQGPGAAAWGGGGVAAAPDTAKTLKLLISCSRFSRTDKTDLKLFWHASFPTYSTFEILRLPKIVSLKNDLGSLLNYLEEFGKAQVRNHGLWGSWKFPLGQKHISIRSSSFLKVKVKSY